MNPIFAADFGSKTYRAYKKCQAAIVKQDPGLRPPAQYAHRFSPEFATYRYKYASSGAQSRPRIVRTQNCFLAADFMVQEFRNL